MEFSSKYSEHIIVWNQEAEFGGKLLTTDIIDPLQLLQRQFASDYLISFEVYNRKCLCHLLVTAPALSFELGFHLHKELGGTVAKIIPMTWFCIRD